MIYLFLSDVFKAVITSNLVPQLLLMLTRVHYTKDISYVSFDGKTWKDTYDLGYINCLKVYTVADDTKIINNNDIRVDYNGGKYFSVKVVTADGHAVGAGANVTFTINKKTKTVPTDKNGIAKIKITDIPKKYTITTKYAGKTYKNIGAVKKVLKTKKSLSNRHPRNLHYKQPLKLMVNSSRVNSLNSNLKAKPTKLKPTKKVWQKLPLKRMLSKSLKKVKNTL